MIKIGRRKKKAIFFSAFFDLLVFQNAYAEPYTFSFSLVSFYIFLLFVIGIQIKRNAFNITLYFSEEKNDALWHQCAVFYFTMFLIHSK